MFDLRTVRAIIKDMKVLRSAITTLVVLATFGCLSSILAATPPLVIQKGDARAERVNSFGGILKGAPLSLTFKAPSVVMDQEKLDALWKAWKLGKVPEVNFATQVVTVATWSGSGPHMTRGIDEEGNLLVYCGGGTKDKIDGFSYVIEIYALSGSIKTVNGKKWPEPTLKKRK